MYSAGLQHTGVFCIVFKIPPSGCARQFLRQGAAALPLFSGMCRGLVSLFPYCLFLSGLFLFFLVIDRRRCCYPNKIHTQGMSGSSSALLRRRP